jgi:hypothetical protein
MNLIRRNPVYPKDRDLSRVVQAAAARLVQKFDGLDPHSLDLSPDGCSLLCQRRESVKEEIERCAHVFAWALPRDDKPFSDLSLVAFADRLGLFALLARECSIGTVVCHNTEGADVDDARIVAKALRSPADHYVFGDLEDLEFVMKQRGISCDVFVSRAGLENLAGARSFFGAITAAPNSAISFGIAAVREIPSKTGPCARENRLDDLRDDLTQAGFRVTLVPVGSAPPLKTARRRLGGFVARGLGLVSGSARGLITGEGIRVVLRGWRGTGTLSAGTGARFSQLDEASREPDRVLSH